MKTVIRILTGIAALTLLFLGSVMEFTAPAIIIACVCISWLALVGIATYRKEAKARQCQQQCNCSGIVTNGSRHGRRSEDLTPLPLSANRRI